ncbi:MAG: hypothetical protein IIB41_02560 [Candidatus Marinimicrobia bacterium]|nr:hypothetical protein [Candidatus Neomarinimicrobiota bacterium]
MEAIDKVSEMVKAGFPCFYIYTEDEISVEDQLRRLAASFGDESYKVEKWTVNTGDVEEFIKKLDRLLELRMESKDGGLDVKK